MTEYFMTIGRKETFYIGPSDLSRDKRLEIKTEDLRYPMFITINNIDQEIKEKVSNFFDDKESIVVHKSGDVISRIHEIFIANKREFDEFDSE